MKVVFAPLVETDLLNLVDILVDEGYISTYPFAIKFVDELIDYILENIETSLHLTAPAFFRKYGTNLKYMIYKSKHQTTWYIMFEERNDCYLVTYITNNKYEGQYFNY